MLCCKFHKLWINITHSVIYYAVLNTGVLGLHASVQKTPCCILVGSKPGALITEKFRVTIHVIWQGSPNMTFDRFATVLSVDQKPGLKNFANES